MMRAASNAPCVLTCAPTDPLDGEEITGVQRGLREALRDAVGIAGGDEAERREPVNIRHGDFVGHAADDRRHPLGERGADGGPHLDRVGVDRDPAFGRHRDGRQGRVGAAAEILGHATDAGAGEETGRLLRFFGRPVFPDGVRGEFVENLVGAGDADQRIAVHGLAAGRQSVAAAELDRIETQRGGGFVDQHLERRHRLQRAVAAHRTRRDPARVHRDRGDVDLRDVVDADRPGRADVGDGG